MLCQSIGKIGGDAAQEVLEKYASASSNIVDYGEIREGARCGLAYLRGERTWQEIAREVVEDVAASRKVDFRSLSERISHFDPNDRHGVWWRVGLALSSEGKQEIARKCFVEALYNDPDPISVCWNILMGIGLGG